MDHFTPPEVRAAAQRENTKSSVRGMLEFGGSLGVALTVGTAAMKELGTTLSREDETAAKAELEAKIKSTMVGEESLETAMTTSKGNEAKKSEVAEVFMGLVEQVMQNFSGEQELQQTGTGN